MGPAEGGGNKVTRKVRLLSLLRGVGEVGGERSGFILGYQGLRVLLKGGLDSSGSLS